MIRLAELHLRYPAGGAAGDGALRGVSLEVARGELVVLAGPSGSGKTSLLRLVAGLRRPTSGVVEVDGLCVSRLPDARAAAFRRERIGMIFQGFELVSGLRVLETVCSPLLPGRQRWPQIRRRAEQRLAELDIGHLAARRVEQLSAGEQQRVAIARALVGDPALILADEPTAALDPELSERLIGFLDRWKSAGKTILVATHDPHLEGMAAADRIVRLRGGRMVETS